MASRSDKYCLNSKYRFKFILIGDPYVGKASLIQRFISVIDYIPPKSGSLVAEIMVKKVKIENDVIRFEIWSTFGQEKYTQIRPRFFQNFNGAVIVYDVNRRKTFENIRAWIEELRRYSSESTDIMLIGNKSDLGNRKVSFEEGKELAEILGLKFMETSAVTGQNVDNVFLIVANELRYKIDLSDSKLAKI